MIYMFCGYFGIVSLIIIYPISIAPNIATNIKIICGVLTLPKFLILAAILFSISAIGTGYANILSVFIFFRLIGGIAIGLASTQSPIYIAEVSPGSMRGKFISLNQLTIVIGILLAQIVNYLIAEDGKKIVGILV